MGGQQLVIRRAKPSNRGWRVCRPVALDVASLGTKEGRRQRREVHMRQMVRAEQGSRLRG